MSQFYVVLAVKAPDTHKAYARIEELIKTGRRKYVQESDVFRILEVGNCLETIYDADGITILGFTVREQERNTNGRT